MLGDDWQDDINKIMSGGGQTLFLPYSLSTKLTSSTDTNEDADHRYMMFSATFPKELRQVARKFLAIDHVRIRVGRAGSTHANVKQQVSCLTNVLCIY